MIYVLRYWCIDFLNNLTLLSFRYYAVVWKDTYNPDNNKCIMLSYINNYFCCWWYTSVFTSLDGTSCLRHSSPFPCGPYVCHSLLRISWSRAWRLWLAWWHYRLRPVVRFTLLAEVSMTPFLTRDHCLVPASTASVHVIIAWHVTPQKEITSAVLLIVKTQRESFLHNTFVSNLTLQQTCLSPHRPRSICVPHQ